MGEIGYRLLQAQPCIFPLGEVHDVSRFTPLPSCTPCHRSDNVQIADQLLGRPYGNGFLFLDFAPGAKKQLRILNDAVSYKRRTLAPSCIDLAYFPGAELIPGNLLGKAFTGVAVGACYRHQILHGGLRSDLSAANLLLDGFGQFLNQRKAARNPR